MRYSYVRTSCTKYISSQSVLNSLGTCTLISSSSNCSTSFYGSCEMTAQVRKANLTILSGDGNSRTASSGCVTRAIQLCGCRLNCRTFDRFTPKADTTSCCVHPAKSIVTAWLCPSFVRAHYCSINHSIKS
jgi:hypothetical protein